MPVYDLEFCAKLENISEVVPYGSDFRWYIQVKCTSCNEVHEDWVYLCEGDRVPLKGSRSSTNLKLKCKFCSRENSADIVPGSVSPYTDDSSEKFSRMMRLDCRGLQPLAFSPRVGWRVTSSVSSRVFEDVDLGQGDWTDYDDEGDQCVGVFDVASRFVSSK
ncbi:hypothetical protein SprV_0902794800 [Sparganum proliferum]